MAKVIQVRDVPDEVHRQLVEHAAAAGLSLNQFLLREYERICRRAGNRRLLEELAAVDAVRPGRLDLLDHVGEQRTARR
jgi:hypothetical protein